MDKTGRSIPVIVFDVMNDDVEALLTAHGEYPFDDNGGEPDGRGWICAVDSLSEELVMSLLQVRCAHSQDGYVYNSCVHIQDGYEHEGYTGTEAQRRYLDKLYGDNWTGFSGAGIAYGVK